MEVYSYLRWGLEIGFDFRAFCDGSQMRGTGAGAKPTEFAGTSYILQLGGGGGEGAAFE
jgi:hypothetical protein